MRLVRNLPRHVRHWSLVLVLFCGSTLGYFVLCTFCSPIHRQYQLDFGPAQWIEPREFAPIAYFRKEIFLNSAPEQAWLEVAATDSFKLIVNKAEVGEESNLKTRVAQIYDIKTILKPGTNVIAISVTRDSYPGSAQLLVRGAFREFGGRTKSFVSDETWRVASNTGIVEGLEQWTSQFVPEQLWPKARSATITEHPIHITWVDTNPLLLQLPSSGKWIMAGNGAREAVFSTSINGGRGRVETWIQAASSGSLDLLVNGKLIISQPATAVSARRVPRLPPLTLEPSKNAAATPSSIIEPPKNSQPLPSPIPSATPTPVPTPPTGEPSSKQISQSMNVSLRQPTIDAYDISYWIKPGSNTIVATVRNDEGPASFLASGFTVQEDGTTDQFETNSKWRVVDSHRAETQALETGYNGSPPWGYLPQKLGKPATLTDIDAVIKPLLVMLFVITTTLVLWLVASQVVAELTNEPLQYVLGRDALFHAAITVGLLFLLLPEYDFRFPINWPFQPTFVALAVLVLVGIRLLHFARPWKAIAALGARIRQIKVTVSPDILPCFLLVAIVGLGCALRYHDFGKMSFDHDEYGLVVRAPGIWELGFPFSRIAGAIRPQTTYELVPYPIAFATALFGDSEWAARLPAFIMGTLCIAVIGLMGRRLFNWSTGLIASLIYACLPMDIRWAQNCFHPQQCQFAAMLTVWFFYEGIRVRPFDPRYLTAASVSFCAAYLSWEGSAFILPSLFLGLLVVYWLDWSWLKEFYLYRCVFFMGALVITELCWRTLFSNDPYEQIGFGLSNVAGPSLFFLQYGWQPMYYVKHLLFSENHVFFTLIAIVGIPFCWSQRAFRYVVAVLAGELFCHTNLIATLSPRYCIYYQPLLVLVGVAAAVTLYDRLLTLATFAGNSTMARSFAHTAGLAMAILLFIQSNEWLMKLYSLSATAATPGFMSRMNTYRYDHRGAAQYVRNHFQPGDLIIVGIPHVFEYYAGMSGDYYTNGDFAKKITYNPKFIEPRFMDKFRGYPVIRGLTELREVVSRGRRTWLVYVPDGGFSNLNSPESRIYLEQNAKVVFESYHAKVYLIGGHGQEPNQAESYSAE